MFKLDTVKMKIESPLLRINQSWLPRRTTPGSAGYDLTACIDEPFELKAGEVKKLESGFAISIEDPNWVCMFFARSGLGINGGVVMASGTGVIDSDYQGVTTIPLWNRNLPGSDPVVIRPGDRVGQMVFLPVGLPDLNIVDDFNTVTERGAGRLGSTGR